MSLTKRTCSDCLQAHVYVPAMCTCMSIKRLGMCMCSVTHCQVRLLMTLHLRLHSTDLSAMSTSLCAVASCLEGYCAIPIHVSRRRVKLDYQRNCQDDGAYVSETGPGSDVHTCGPE